MLKEIWSQKFVLEVLSTYFTVKTFHWEKAQSRPLTRQSEPKVFPQQREIFSPWRLTERKFWPQSCFRVKRNRKLEEHLWLFLRTSILGNFYFV